MARWTPNRQRFKELLLYVSERCTGLSKFGATKLNKILFYSDSLALALLGSPITGYEYQKLQNGPAPVGVVDVRNEMVENGELSVQVISLSEGKAQHRPVARRSANTKLFTPEELQIVDRVIEMFAKSTAQDISGYSHLELGWKAARLHERIPYGTIFLSDKPLIDEEIRRIQQFAGEHGYATR